MYPREYLPAYRPATPLTAMKLLKVFGSALLAILAFAFFPLAPILICLVPGCDCSGMNEGNSSLAVLPWLVFFTVPTAVVALFVWAITLAIYIYKYWRSR